MVQGVISDISLWIRFKHGNTTVVLFVEPDQSFSSIQQELLAALEERYPDGIMTSTIPPKRTKLPRSAKQIKFALPKDADDLSQGWTPLKISRNDTPLSKRIEDNMAVAFAFATDDEEDTDNVKFEVELPVYREEAEGEEDL